MSSSQGSEMNDSRSSKGQMKLSRDDTLGIIVNFGLQYVESSICMTLHTQSTYLRI